MAQVITDTQLENPQKRRAGDDSLIGLADWLKAQEEAEAKAETARLAEESTTKKPKKGFGKLEVTTIVTGRPTTNNLIDLNDLLPCAEPFAPIKVDLGGKNWVGQLFEYRQAHPYQTGPDYQESSPSLNLFTCLVSIGERPLPLGDPKGIFSRKKDAKQYAAKLAVEWLIANHHMPSDGSVSFPKPRPLPTPKASPAPRSLSVQNRSPPDDDTAGSNSTTTTTTNNNNGGPSYGQRVAELCTKLAMSPPSYVITPHAEFQAMYSGYAVFENSPVVVGRVGEFYNAYGKKRARETCAEMVLGFLEGVARDRARRGAEGAVPAVPDVETVESLLD